MTRQYLSFFLARLCCILAFSTSSVFAQPAIQWKKCLGGSGTDYASGIEPTADGGYVVAGHTTSNNGNVSGNHGSYDGWVVKLSADGAIQWTKALGGTFGDFFRDIQQTTDGGYILTGDTNSDNGDVSGNHGETDGWVVKLNASGEMQWQKALGGTSDDYFYAVQQTIDGGYIVTGSAFSKDGDLIKNYGAEDYWVVKLNAMGDIQWQKSLGGTADEYATSIQQTADSGYILTGICWSDDVDVMGHHGFNNSDYWVVKLDNSGNIEWQKSLGGTNIDDGIFIQQTTDGGYIAAGLSYSVNGDITGHHGTNNADYWIVKLNPTGTIEWQKSLGGTDLDRAHCVRQTKDGGYIVGGESFSKNEDVSGNHGKNDYWLVKLNAGGDIQWQMALGGSNDDELFDIHQTQDEGYILGGSTNSINGNVNGNHGSADYWIVKLGPYTPSSTQNPGLADALIIAPNPTSSRMTIRLDNAYTIDAYTLGDVNGQTLLAAEYNQPVQETTLDPGELPKGIYLLQVRSGKQFFVRKIIVQ